MKQNLKTAAIVLLAVGSLFFPWALLIIPLVLFTIPLLLARPLPLSLSPPPGCPVLSPRAARSPPF